MVTVAIFLSSSVEHTELVSVLVFVQFEALAFQGSPGVVRTVIELGELLCFSDLYFYVRKLSKSIIEVVSSLRCF